MVAEYEIPASLGDGGSHLPRGLALALRSIVEDLDAINARSAGTQVALDALVAKYNSHIGSAGVHVEADTDNPVTSPVATDPVADILALLNDAVVQYEAHRVLIAASVHGAADATNVITATNPATDEAEGIALANDLKAMYEAHRILTAASVHANPDATNTIASGDATDWDSLVTLINEFKNTTGYEAHRVLTAGPVHGAADSTNVITAPDAGTQITALTTELNEIKTDYNAHAAQMGVHVNAGASEGTANMSDEATGVALTNALKATLNTHFANADPHLDADGSSSVSVGDATEYEDILATVADVRAQYEAHRIITAIHAKADGANAGSVLGTGSAVTVGTTVEPGTDQRLGIGV